MNCLECKKEVIQTPGKRERQFCNSTCRSNYWQKAKRKIAKNNIPENKKRIKKERKTSHKLSENNEYTQPLEISAMEALFQKLKNEKK
jgi:endogenous inhibitor of DNA gyrase (YacG/DUF329 family)